MQPITCDDVTYMGKAQCFMFHTFCDIGRESVVDKCFVHTVMPPKLKKRRYSLEVGGS